MNLILMYFCKMKQKIYEYKSENESLWYEFESVSEVKIVKKVVVYTPFEDNPNLYNLALADAFPDGSYSDKSITNNDDMDKVMATVIQTLLRFFEKYPSKMIYFEGSSPERTRLYRIILSRELFEIEKLFFVYGIIDNNPQLFEKNQNYNAYVIALKNQENLLKLLYENDNQ
jgi:hypothetical protein